MIWCFKREINSREVMSEGSPPDQTREKTQRQKNIGTPDSGEDYKEKGEKST